MGLIWHQANISQRLLTTLSQGSVRRSLLSLIYYPAFFIPMYAVELGVNPQANFAHRPESQGLLRSTVYVFLQVHLGF